MKRRRRRLAAMSIAAVLFCAHVPAQTSSGTIVGHVSDPSGQAIANGQITLLNQSTGESRGALTDVTGDFVITSVQPGAYNLRVRVDGFKELEKAGLVLTASERLSAGNLTLAFGTVTESIMVEAEATPVQTASQERSALLNDKQMETLMARGRDFMGFFRVLPGVVGGGGGESLGTSGTPTINGVRSEYNLATIDGVVGNTRGLNTLDTPLNLDAIAEVKVLSANYQAE